MVFNKLILPVWLALALSGCLGSTTVEDRNSYPPQGLGLNIPDELPPPGPYREASEDIHTLADFLRETGHEILEYCKKADASTSLERFVGEEDYGGAWYSLYIACLPVGLVEETAAQAIETGNEKEIRDELLSQAKSAVRKVKDKLSSHPGPGNVVEAQLLARISGKHVGHVTTLDNNTWKRWTAYENGSHRNELQLKAAYMGYLSVVQRSEVLEMFLDRYPWTGPACRSPDVDGLRGRIQEKIEKAHDQAALFGHNKVKLKDETHTAYENTQYNRLMNWIIPRFTYMGENGWWPGLVGIEGVVDMHLAYWDSFSDPAWPTLEEAEFMLAQHRNESRTLMHESHFDGFITYFADEEVRTAYEWEDDQPGVFLAVLSMPWRYGDLDCGGTAPVGS